MTLSPLVRPLAFATLAALGGCGKAPITAELLAAEANQRATLPMDLGDGFRLDSITAEGNTVISTVTLLDDALAGDPRFKDVIATATKSDICRELLPAKQAYIDSGLRVSKVYKNAKGVELVRVDVRGQDCS